MAHKLRQTGGQKQNFTLPTYREVVVVRNGEATCQMDCTREALLSRGFEDVPIEAPVEETPIETPVEETPVETPEPEAKPKTSKKSKKKSSSRK